MASALQVKRKKKKLGQHLLCMVSALQVMRAVREMMRSLLKFCYKLNVLNVFGSCICR